MTQHFSAEEARCKCCGQYNPIGAHLLAVRLEQVRTYAGNKPIVIASWCRCSKQNARAKGRPNSAHLRSLAVDILCHDDSRRFILVDSLTQLGFDRLGIYPTWIHADLDPSLDQFVLWTA
jgi:hypothetical protein